MTLDDMMTYDLSVFRTVHLFVMEIFELCSCDCFCMIGSYDRLVFPIGAVLIISTGSVSSFPGPSQQLSLD